MIAPPPDDGDAGRLDDIAGRLGAAAEQYAFQPHSTSVGHVVSIADGVARISGLPGAALSERVTIGEGRPGIVLDLDEDELGVALLDDPDGVHVGDVVVGTGDVLCVPVGDELLGRVVDPLGRPADGGPDWANVEAWPIERPAPPLVDRAAVREPLSTGITAVDALFPIGRGQRELIVGDRGTGKSTLAIDAVLNQRDTGVRCVIVSIGQQSSSVVQLLDRLRRHDALQNTVVVIAPPSSTPGFRFIAPYAGCTIAEYFRDRGEEALIIFDDLTEHAVAYRELALLLRRPPGREAYPGDIFYVHSRLLERGTRLSDRKGGGSLTMLPIAETHAGRISDFIPTNLISITDGQLYLDPMAFDRGVKPAVDVGLSVSRVGGRTQRPAMKAVASKLRLDAARFREIEVFSRFGGRVDASTQRLLARGERIRELLKQGPGRPRSPAQQVALLVALEEGCFDNLATEEVAAHVDRLLAGIAGRSEEFRHALAEGPPPTDDLRRAVRSLLEEA
ncbi:MAG: F0F1 ATP synthase subunit alpha [Nannocystales bacterium]